MPSIDIQYRKVRPLNIDSLAKQYVATEYDNQHNYNPFAVHAIQAFNPLYTDFFVLNDTNFNRVGLNQQYYIENDTIKSSNHDILSDIDNSEKKYHVKCSPLLDPVHYLVGKYANTRNIRVLPKLTNQSECCQKIYDKNNASYIDGFFSYLSSRLKYQHNMLNAIDFYGSYLALQKVFKATITDDLDYLHQSDYFMDNIGKGFTICCGETFDDFTGIGSRANKKRLVLEDEIDIADLSADIISIDEPLHIHMDKDADNKVNISCEYAMSDNSSEEEEEEEDDEEEEEEEKEAKEEEEEDDEEEENNQEDNNNTNTEENDESDSETEYGDDDTEDESDAYAYIDNFPTNLIFLEKCDGTLDRLFMDHEIDANNGAAYMMQIIMSLIAFQKAFHFTHNDLHTNNVMYINTDIEFLYYKYDNLFYRVPTYGKIFKIIDFGRAIYKFKNRIYCSDSFAPKGDAHSQYNTEPYFNEKHPRIEPNLSFDLCRLGTSIYDFVIDNEDEPRDDFQETIYRWCLDDNGKNVMYRRSGEERYPGFKLYKMIARNVHAHTPQEQLKYSAFSQFLMNPTDAAKLDESKVRRYGLNIDLVKKEYF